MTYLDNAFASLLRSESFEGIRYVKSFIEADKESIVTSDTIDFENIKINKEYPYAAMLLKFYREAVKEFYDSSIDMLSCIYGVERAIDLEENRRIIEQERNMCKPVKMPSIPVQAPRYDNNMHYVNIDNQPILTVGVGTSTHTTTSTGHTTVRKNII